MSPKLGKFGNFLGRNFYWAKPLIKCHHLGAVLILMAARSIGIEESFSEMSGGSSVVIVNGFLLSAGSQTEQSSRTRLMVCLLSLASSTLRSTTSSSINQAPRGF